MTPEERGRRLVGDMPWITEGLTEAQIDDLRKQITTSIWVAEQEAAAREREACAKEADFVAGTSGDGICDWSVRLAGRNVAAAIRARK